MSFGDPNNPYGQPQGQPQGQPGYGQPQQPGYGYPQAPPVQPYGDGGYGYGAGPTEMPGGVKASRVMLFVIAGFQFLGAIITVISVLAVSAAKNDDSVKDDVQFQQLADFSTGALWASSVLILLWGVLALFLALKFKTGGNGIRVTTMVFAIITAILGIYPFIVVGLVHTVLAVIVAVFVGKSEGSAWFNRGQHSPQH